MNHISWSHHLYRNESFCPEMHCRMTTVRMNCIGIIVPYEPDIFRSWLNHFWGMKKFNTFFRKKIRINESKQLSCRNQKRADKKTKNRCTWIYSRCTQCEKYLAWYLTTESRTRTSFRDTWSVWQRSKKTVLCIFCYWFRPSLFKLLKTLGKSQSCQELKACYLSYRPRF